MLGSAGFALSGSTSLSIAESGQVCPTTYNYLTQLTLEVFNTALLFAEEDDFPMSEWTPNEEEDEFPMSEWTPFTFSGTALLTDAVLEPNSPSANAEDLAIDYFDGYGDGSGPWSITDAGGNVVATGTMDSGPTLGVPTSNSGSVALAPGHYTFSWNVDCYGAYDNSGIQLSLNGETLVDFAPGTLTPGIITTDIFIPGIIITPPSAYVDTTCDAVFTHDFMAPGMLPPSTPGTYIASEDNIQLGFEMFFDGFGATYGSAAVTPALPTVGSGQVLTTSNILAVYDMSAFPNVNEVSFVFFDGAGIENLQVNGYSLLTGELETMPAAVAPGVTMSVTTSAYPGYQTGTVVLTGNVQKLEVGGQQFFVDHICVKHDGTVIQNPTTGGCTATCDVFAGFDLLTAGDRYGDPAEGANINVAIGTQATTSDGVPIYLEPLHDFGTASYKYMAVGAHYGGWGSGMALWTNNITAQFDIQSVIDVTDTVCIAFRDEGGFENLWVNGAAPAISPTGYGGLTVFNGAVIGGVQVQVTGANVGYAFEGTITLIGDVDKLSIGGQELWLDDLCISGIGGGTAPGLTTVDEDEFLEGIEYNLVSLNGDDCQSLLSIDMGIWEGQADSLSIALMDENGLPGGEALAIGPGQFLLTGSSTSPLSISLAVFVLELLPVLVVDLPGIDIPDCPIDVPCLAVAGFFANDIGNCMAQIQYTGTPGMQQWTLDGAPIMGGNAFTLPIAEPGQQVCVTVTDPNDPSCTDSFCATVLVNCGGDNQADSCDVEFTHEFMAPGDVSTPGPNAVIATEDNIDLSLDVITYATSGTNFGTATIQPAQPEAGDGQVLWLNNVMAVYDLSGLGQVEQVRFEFLDYGGQENLRINGNLLVDDIDNMTGVLGGLSVVVNYNSYPGFISGEVTITGDVQELGVAGQEFYIDNICVVVDDTACADTDADGLCDEDEVAGCTDASADNYDPNATDDDGSCNSDGDNETTEIILNFGPACPSNCDELVDFESQMLGSSWGDPTAGPVFPLLPGDFMFNENGIDMFIDRLNNLIYGPTYNMNIITSSPWPAFGMGHVMHTNNATVTFDLDSIVTDSVCLDILDLGGFEFLEVNGVGFSSMNGYGQLTSAPMSMGGVQVQVVGNPIITTTSTGPMVTGYNGRLVLHGNVDKLEIGGQEFWIDNLCISEGMAVAPAAPGCTYEDAENYDPEANQDDGSCDFETANPCPTDIDGNGVTATQDLLLLLGNFSMECED